MRQNASDLICRYVYKSVSYMIAIDFFAKVILLFDIIKSCKLAK